jgi:hypothetical protein
MQIINCAEIETIDLVITEDTVHLVDFASASRAVQDRICKLIAYNTETKWVIEEEDLKIVSYNNCMYYWEKDVCYKEADIS